MKKTIVLYIIFFMLAVGVAEVFLYVVELLRPPGRFHPLDDEVLGHRPNPKHPDHDNNGFRNREIPKYINIVALGDSQTYGHGVRREDAWPQQLQNSTGVSVYNMGYGGYGPVHSLLLLEEVLALKPEIVIEAFYSGNDLYDSFNIAYNLNNFDFLKTHDQQVSIAIQEHEDSKSLNQKVSEKEAYHRVRSVQGDGESVKASESTTFLYRLKFFSYRHIKLYKLLADAKVELFSRRAEKVDRWNRWKKHGLTYPEDCLVLETEDFQTLFAPQYRLTALDTDDPRILEGLKISLKTLSLMREKTEAAGVQFMVLLIPTKELVFSQVVTEQNTVNDDARKHYATLLQYEKDMWETTKDYLQNERIHFVDTLPCLQKSLSEYFIQPYPFSTDGHPNRSGYTAIVECLTGSALGSKKWH